MNRETECVTPILPAMGEGAKGHLKHVACYTYHAEIDDHLSIFPHSRMGSGQWRVQGQKPPQTLKLCSAIQIVHIW